MRFMTNLEWRINNSSVIHNQLDAATTQLERAIKLFLDDADYYSAGTLGGASEEILGKTLKSRGNKHALDSLMSAITEIQTVADVPTIKENKLSTQLNEVRDWLKHYKGKNLEFDAKEAAAELIDRAISNYYQLTGQKTAEMIRFTGSGE